VLTYRELAPKLADYAVNLASRTSSSCRSWSIRSISRGATRWRATVAPPAGYGTPQDFMYLVDHLHQRGIGVILDWVPSHFPTDGVRFAELRRHAPVRARRSAPWAAPGLGSSIFNYGRNEVRGFLMSSALCWLNRYHADGLRVDGVASMALPRLLAQAGRVDPQQVRRAREPRGCRFPAAIQYRGL